MESFLHVLPKVELHLHIEGTLEPSLVFQLAKRNNIPAPFESMDALQEAHANFTDLQSFLDIFEKELRVLVTSEDFYDLAWAYFQRAAKDNVRHCEMFLDVQAHLNRGVTLKSQFDGLSRACQRAQTELNMTTGILISFVRHESEQSALEVLEKALEYREHFIGIALDSTEVGNPPSKFVKLYQRAQELGLHRVAHAGEEGPASYVKEAIELLHIERIDHGIHCVDDPVLMQYIARKQIPLTLCPLSNVKLKVVKNLSDHPIKLFLDNGMKVTINSDDPPYFDAYILANYNAVQEAFQFSIEDWIQLTKNAIDAAFITDQRRKELLNELKRVLKNYE